MKNTLQNTYNFIFEESLINEILEISKIHDFKEGDIIIDFNENIKNMPLMLTGAIKILREDDLGNELLMYYLQPGDTCTMSLTCCMANRKSEIRAIAEGSVTMLAVPVNFMDDWMIKYPDWKNFVMNTYRKRFEELLNTVDQIAFKKMDERLENYLKEKSIVTKTHEIKITHQEIANDLNSSREVISRLLKQLEKQGKVKLNRLSIDVSLLFV